MVSAIITELDISLGASPDPASSCRFCGYLEEGADSFAQWTIIAETEHLVAVPSVGSLIPGWLLVMPKEHVLSFGAVSADKLALLTAEVHRIAERWQSLFGPLTWFEHGPAKTRSSVGCGIDHAHMHLLPAGHLDLLNGARELFPALAFGEVAGPEAAADAVALGNPYLYLRTDDGRSWLTASRDIPSQAFRRVVAHQQKRPDEYDWKAFPRDDTLEATLKMVRRLDFAA
jgi:ATP adenylyltransferase